ncbi:MAG: hypothetical protein F4089_04825 [Gammaproteobacteria bacterium]|nr:hypothetical protein [Gammaproteobacteria bacterium]
MAVGADRIFPHEQAYDRKSSALARLLRLQVLLLDGNLGDDPWALSQLRTVVPLAAVKKRNRAHRAFRRPHFAEAT